MRVSWLQILAKAVHLLDIKSCEV
ncbi:MAG: hypothetical protein OSP8Acid_04880 [uncultured Acidilobus sp. OSP8]|nr:MAG: hypothetical protein OSP8Acid_04880 [uncultured Acidilobus sp. OSP8]